MKLGQLQTQSFASNLHLNRDPQYKQNKYLSASCCATFFRRDCHRHNYHHHKPPPPPSHFLTVLQPKSVLSNTIACRNTRRRKRGLVASLCCLPFCSSIVSVVDLCCSQQPQLSAATSMRFHDSPAICGCFFSALIFTSGRVYLHVTNSAAFNRTSEGHAQQVARARMIS